MRFFSSLFSFLVWVEKKNAPQHLFFKEIKKNQNCHQAAKTMGIQGSQ